MCDHHNGGGVLNIFGSHVIDLLQYLTDGRRVERVHGVVRTFCRHTSAIDGIRQITSDDLASFQLEMSGGVLANVVLNSQMVGHNQVLQSIRVLNSEIFHFASSLQRLQDCLE